MKKKMMAGVITLLSVATLAACGNSSSDKDIVTMKGDTITVNEFYNEIKNNNAAKQTLLQMTIENIFESKYGKKVSDEDVQKSYDKSTAQYGDQLAQALAQSGLTPETYRKQIRTNMLVEYAVKEEAKKTITDETTKAAYDAYTPEVTVQVIQMDAEDKAKEVQEKAKNGEDFAGLAKENSTDTATKDKAGEMKFDSASSTLPTEVNKVVFGMEKDQVSDVIGVANPQTGKTNYYIVKMINKSEKKADWKEYKKRLEEIQLNAKLADPTYIRSVVAKELQAANIKVKDQAFQDLFTQYIQSDAGTSSSSASSSK